METNIECVENVKMGQKKWNTEKQLWWKYNYLLICVSFFLLSRVERSQYLGLLGLRLLFGRCHLLPKFFFISNSALYQNLTWQHFQVPWFKRKTFPLDCNDICHSSSVSSSVFSHCCFLLNLLRRVRSLMWMIVQETAVSDDLGLGLCRNGE